MDDADELAALRDSQRFKQHQAAFGRGPAPSSGSAGSGSSASSGGFRSAAQRKLDALNAANAKWKARAQHTDDEGEDGTAAAVAAGKKQRTDASAMGAAGSSLSARAASAPARGASPDADAEADDDEPVIVSDASAAEQAMLASMFPSSFGAAPRKGPDLAKLNAAHVRKDRESAAKVKIEGDMPAPPGADHSTQRPVPRKVPVPVAPASLLGSGYDSSDDDEDATQNGQTAAAASSSSTAGAVASSSAAALSTDDEADSDADEAGGLADGRRPHPLLRTLPISHEVEMKTNGHTKTVSALALDRAGSRVVSGAYDYQAKLWDFAGMTSSMAAFRTWEPTEGHHVRALQFSPSGDSFLCVTGGATPKIYSRDGIELCELARGDMYIMQQQTTRGHSTAVTSGWWHPTDRGWMISSGIDGTVRVWDVNNSPDKNVCVIKPRGLMRGVGCSATALSRDGKLIAAAYTDGSIRLLKHSKAHEYRDDKVMTGAHVKGSETSALVFSGDGFTLWSRGGDGDHTLKQWDVRAFKQPVHVLAELENSYPETDIALSPDERVLVTGTSSRDARDRSADGHAVFIDRASMQPIQRVSMGCKSVVRTVWHAGINQLLFGCNDGAIRLLYDPSLSTKGALQCIGKRARVKSALDFAQESVHIGSIITPHALPSMRGDETKSRKRAREKAAESMAPEAPLAGRFGVGGRAAGSQSMAAFHLSKVVAMKTDPREKDPREALLAMDALTKADPMFFRANPRQPKPIFAEVPEEERMVAMTQEEVDAYNKKEGQTK